MVSSKSDYIRVKNAEHKEEFYSLAVNVPGEDDVFEIRRGRRGSIPVLTPIKGASNIPMEGGFAAVNNTVYCIGGDPVKQPKVFGHHRSLPTLFSLDNSSRSWKRRPSMRTARSQPQTVAVDGKIYVILQHCGGKCLTLNQASGVLSLHLHHCLKSKVCLLLLYRTLINSYWDHMSVSFFTFSRQRRVVGNRWIIIWLKRFHPICNPLEYALL